MELFGGPDDVQEEAVDSWLRQQHALIVPGMPSDKMGAQPGMDSSEGEDEEASVCSLVSLQLQASVDAVTQNECVPAAGC